MHEIRTKRLIRSFCCHRVAQATLALALASCAPPSGEISFVLEPESTLLDGIQAGSDFEKIQDGWNVTFSKYIVSLGPVEVRSRAGASPAFDRTQLAVDLTRLPAQGTPLWEVSGLEEGRWDVYFGTEAAGFEQHETVSDEDFDLMAERELTHLILGTLTNPTGVSCPPASLATLPDDAEVTGQNAADDDCYAAPSVTFSIQLRAEVTYGPCSIDGLPGVAVGAGERATAAISMHGDHLFFGGFPEGSEGEVRRYAQWLADCDLDLNGTVTTEELEQIPPSALVEFDERFPLGGSPLRPVDSMLTYAASQLSTQGHFEGEGECSLAFEPLGVP